ncbi:CHAT domain-containing protein [Streptomyces sp. XH2]|uniref:CHAT domain-containing protein n=1 Tax=Streptomyces sp. XH2 TaxID=3412483 RepID=UPI003C7DAF72
MARIRISHDPADLDETVLTVGRAAESTPQGHPDHAMFLHNLGIALMTRHFASADEKDDEGSNPPDPERALSALRRAARLTTAQTAVRLRSARNWADLAMRLPRPDRAGALERRRPEDAVELLEQGRAVLWGHVMRRRSDLTALRAADPALSERLEQLRRALDHPAPPSAADRAALAGEFDVLVERVRELPGCADLFRPAPFARRCRAAEGGPVVIVNLGRLRCDALIVHGGRVDPLPLATTVEEAEERASAYLTAVSELEKAHGVRALAAEEAIGTVLAALAHRRRARPAPPGALVRAGRRPALATGLVVPTGALSLLPLHTAGLGPYEHPGRSVPDRVVSSYTPTLAALCRARRPSPPAGHGQGGMLLVSMGETPGARPLEGPGEEAALLGARLDPPPLRLDGPRATRDAVRGLLPAHRWFHFSGHGTQDLGDPTRGGLRLHDGLLTVHDLARLGAGPGAEPAFLSACQTAVGGAQVPDEGIHLASALQPAGYRHVVAALWNVHDAPAARLARAVYDRLITGGSIAPAGALHHAVRALRAERPYRPSVWAPFLHAGL